jgi:hypothetical protein
VGTEQDGGPGEMTLVAALLEGSNVNDLLAALLVEQFSRSTVRAKVTLGRLPQLPT